MFESLKEFIQLKSTTDLEASYRAQKIWDQLANKNLSANDIYHIQQSFGYDIACGILHKSFKETSQFIEFNKFLENKKEHYSRDHKDILAVVLVHNPWESKKQNESYQWRLKNVAADAGFECAFPEIQYRRSIYPNAYFYQDLLKRWAGRKVVFITHGLASLELRLVLERSVQLQLQILGWLNVSGMLYGTSLPPTNNDLFFSMKKYINDEYPVLPEVGRSQSYCYGPLKFANPVPMVNVVGVRPHRYYYFFEKVRDQKLAYWGPHDGYVTLSDYLQKPGVTWPLWGQSHYIDVDIFKRRLQASLRWLVLQNSSEALKISPHK
jgi:hypothetical protein